jgi:hypothetical protein
MTKARDISDKNGRRLVQLFEDILATLPTGVAALEARRTRDDRGTIVRLRPANAESAEFSAHVEDGYALVDVSFGRGATFELPWDADLPNNATFDTTLETVLAMCRAVIAGRCEDRLGFLGIRSTICVDEKRVFRMTDFFHPNLHPRVVRYGPYYPIIEV